MRVALLGDFLPAGSADPVIRDKGYAYLFGGVRDVLGASDVVFLNLETPLSLQGEPVADKKYTFRAEPAAAKAMAEEGINIVSLANNHIMDFGPDALWDTMENLQNADISHSGAGMNLDMALIPGIKHLPDDHIVAVVAFSNTLPRSYWARSDRPGTHFGSPKAVKHWVKNVAVAEAVTTVIASFHWGAELMTEPKEYQVNLARLAIDSGASLVVGHHPHVPQPIEIYRGVPILYSLGNFSFGSYSRNATVGLMAVAHFAPDGACERLEVYPLLVDNTRVAFRPLILTGLETSLP